MPHPSLATVGEPRWYKAGSTGGWRFVWVLQASLWPSPPQGLYTVTHPPPGTRYVPAEVHPGLGTECNVVGALAAPPTRGRGEGTKRRRAPFPAADSCSGDSE